MWDGMKILFCSPSILSPKLGASRVVTGVAAGLEPLGWQCRIVDRQEMAQAVGLSPTPEQYPQALRTYLRQHAAKYHVVDYDNHHLPFPRSEFALGTLFVARSVLLMDHLLQISPPDPRSVYRRLKGLLSGGRIREREQVEGWVRAGHVTARNADLVNVANIDDQRVLRAAGVDAEKICVIPYGLGKEELAALDRVNLRTTAPLRVCFLGTFDERKGAGDLTRLCEMVGKKFPGCRFRLVGTAGQFRSAEEVRSRFPARIRGAVEVVPRFERADLPRLLDDCIVGVFPSYAEGFGFGVLEMMAAGIPVIAYQAPGPPMMLTEEFLVPRGDVTAMAGKIQTLLHDENHRRALAVSARRRASEFTWERACHLTDESYREHLSRLTTPGSA